MSRIKVNQAIKDQIDKDIALRAAKQDADAWFANQVAAGFVGSQEIKLGLDTTDVALLTGNFVLAKEADSIGSNIPPVIDMDGNVHEMSMAQLTELMLEYGQHRAAISAAYKQRISVGE